MKDVVLVLDRDVAGMSAVRGAGIRRELVGGSFVVEQRIAPAARRREMRAVLLHDERLREDVRHIDGEGSLRALLWLPLELHHLRTLGERLAIARNAGLVCGDHDGVTDDDLEDLVSPGGRA